jgi:hypothetical protein
MLLGEFAAAGDLGEGVRHVDAGGVRAVEGRG